MKLKSNRAYNQTINDPLILSLTFLNKLHKRETGHWLYIKASGIAREFDYINIEDRNTHKNNQPDRPKFVVPVEFPSGGRSDGGKESSYGSIR